MPLPTEPLRKPPPLTLAKAARLVSGVSQRQFAARVGLNRRTVARVESGVGTPTLRTAKRIAAGLDPDEIEAEIDSFHDAMLTAMFIASGPDLKLDPAKFPRTAQRLREVVGRMTELAIGNARLAADQGPATEAAA